MGFARTYSYGARLYLVWLDYNSLRLYVGPTRIGTRYWRRWVLAFVGKHSVRVLFGC